jgi:3-deoxy-7-phosphoheptulonate synthase
VVQASESLRAAGLNPRLLVDCSHDNSGKNHEHQAKVLSEVARQLEAGSEHVLGVMLESNLVAGRQDLVAGRTSVFGQSITDACIDFETTEALLYRLAAAHRSALTKPGARVTFGAP